MLQEMKKQLAENIKKAIEDGELTASQIYNITNDGVVTNAQNLKTGAKDIRDIAKEAVTSTVQTLVEAEETSVEKISAALHGAVGGIKHVESQTLDNIHKELSHGKKRLKDEEAKLAGGLNEAYEGAREAAGNFTEEVKTNIETALADAKLNSSELLGLTQDTVKEAIREAIETGADVEKTIVNVTRNATSKALAEARFSAKRARKVSETVLSAAVEAAEELNSHVKETASAATEGVRQGLADSVDFTHESITKTGKGVKEFATEDLEHTKEDLEIVGDLFVETLRKVADRSGNVAKDILHELADDAKKAGSNLREKAVAASGTIAERLKELGSEAVQKTEEVGSQAAHALAKETSELADRTLAIARGAASGMREGAKDAFNKDENKEDKS